MATRIIIVPFSPIVADAALAVLSKKKTYEVEYSMEYEDTLPPSDGITVRFKVIDGGNEDNNTTEVVLDIGAPYEGDPEIQKAMFNLLLTFMKL